MLGAGRTVNALVLKEIRDMTNQLAVLLLLHREETDAAQLLQHLRDAGRFFAVRHQFAPNQGRMRIKIAYVVGIIEQTDSQEPRFGGHFSHALVLPKFGFDRADSLGWVDCWLA